MKVSNQEFLDQVKLILKRIPGTQSLNNIRHSIMRIFELSDLLKKKRFVGFNLYSMVGNDPESTRAIVQDYVKEMLDVYGIVHLRSATTAAMNSPVGAVLLWEPLALLEIPTTHEEYIKGVERGTRRAIRLAEKQGYEFKEFVWNDHLDEIYEINTSKEVRQSEPMRGWYREPVQPRYHSKEELQYRKYYGAFKDGILYAYLHFYIFGDLAAPKHIIGHAQHLKYGIMNGLISYAVQECIKNSQIRWLYYGAWQGKGTLNAFKKHAGFQGYAILLDLNGDQELLKYSKQKVKMLWPL